MTETPANKYEEKMSEEEFIEAVRLYESGESTLNDIADEHGITRQGLSQRFRRAGVVKNSKVMSPEKMRERAEKEARELAEKNMERFAEQRGSLIEEVRMTGIKRLKQAQLLAVKIVSDAVNAKNPMATIEDDMKAIQRYNRVLADNISASLNLLNADNFIDDESLSILQVDDLTDEEVLEHHKNTGAFPQDFTVEEMLAEDLGDIPIS